MGISLYKDFVDNGAYLYELVNVDVYQREKINLAKIKKRSRNKFV